MSLFTPQWGLMFWMLVAFLPVVLILGKFAWPIIMGMIRNRDEYINSSLEAADEANRKLQEIRIERERILEDAHKDQIRLLHEAKEIKDRIIGQAESEAREKADLIIEAAKASIEKQKQEALQEMRKEVVMLSLAVAEKILSKEISKDGAQEALINHYLDQMYESQAEK